MEAEQVEEDQRNSEENKAEQENQPEIKEEDSILNAMNRLV